MSFHERRRTRKFDILNFSQISSKTSLYLPKLPEHFLFPSVNTDKIKAQDAQPSTSALSNVQVIIQFKHSVSELCQSSFVFPSTSQTTWAHASIHPSILSSSLVVQPIRLLPPEYWPSPWPRPLPQQCHIMVSLVQIFNFLLFLTVTPPSSPSWYDVNTLTSAPLSWEKSETVATLPLLLERHILLLRARGHPAVHRCSPFSWLWWIWWQVVLSRMAPWIQLSAKFTPSL